MSKLRKKIVVPISHTLTGCLVVAAFVLNDSLTKVDANVAFILMRSTTPLKFSSAPIGI